MTKENGVCRVEVATVEWDCLQPWQKSRQSKSSGTAFVIDDSRLITNAHVVRSAIDIRVRPHGSTRRFPAKVVCYAPDVDLALLEICGESERSDFFGTGTGNGNGNGNDSDNDNGDNNGNGKSMALEFATELPALRESIHVVGYPTGGRTICVTEGVVSRIDLYDRIVAIQVDSAINPGNSGGPAFNSKGQVTGIAFSKRVSVSKISKVDNIGYLIPAVVVRAFLGRVNAQDGTYAISGAMPYRWHSLENHSLRLAHRVPDSVHGILITSVCETEETVDDSDNIDVDVENNGGKSESTGTFLQQGDILVKIDDKKIADDGQVVLRGDELIQHAYLMRIKLKDEPTTFTVYRDGKFIECSPHIFRDIKSIIPRWRYVDYMPNYMILGSVVLLPLSLAMKKHTQCGYRLKADCIHYYQKWPKEWEGKTDLVVLTDIFAHELTFSYTRPWRQVIRYNGVEIKSLKHLQELWDESVAAVEGKSTGSGDDVDVHEDDPSNSEDEPTFARLELENDNELVFEVKAAIKAQKEVMETHAIPKAFQILPPNPNYK